MVQRAILILQGFKLLYKNILLYKYMFIIPLFICGVLKTIAFSPLIITNVNMQPFEPFLHDWHCVGIKENINFEKPYAFNIGDLPMVLWKQKRNNTYLSTINVCKHMGSKLFNAKITDNGCLKCQYHGYEYETKDQIGQTIEHQGKIFWSYNPRFPKPYSVPFYNNKLFVCDFVEITMPCSLQDSAYNTMDMRHPEYVHNNIFGFGNSIPPQNIKHHNYKYNPHQIGLSFDYVSSGLSTMVKKDSKLTHNFHMYEYPSFTWSKVTFNRNNHLIVGVNLLQTGPKKTKWTITVCNNYMKTPIQRQMIKGMAMSILTQDYIQMQNQYKENILKKEIMFQHKFQYEESIEWLYQKFADYSYMDIEKCFNFVKNHNKNTKQ
jgi:phenylpropionate dioxygenase-like ring-hydroxylating dioxygenase large terminal subunit